jgi:hypothetical protein
MPIQIVQDDERLTYENAGSKIFYRRISTAKRSAIVRKHTKRGKTDWNAVTSDLVTAAIIGWSNVQVKGKDVQYDPDLALKLPEEVLSEIVALTGGTGEDEENGDPEKN